MSETQHKTNQLPIVAVLIMGTFIAILNQTLLTTALPPIMRDLNITPGLAQWLTTVFMLVNGIMIPVTAFLIEKFTTRKLFMAAMSLFTAGTLICALSFSFSALIVGRVVQAAGAGIMMPLMQTVLLLIFPKEKRGSAMGMVGLVIAFAPAVGPTLSGWIVDRYPWEVLFYLLLPFAVIDMIAAHFILKMSPNRRRLRWMSLPSYCLHLASAAFCTPSAAPVLRAGRVRTCWPASRSAVLRCFGSFGGSSIWKNRFWSSGYLNIRCLHLRRLSGWLSLCR